MICLYGGTETHPIFCTPKIRFSTYTVRERERDSNNTLGSLFHDFDIVAAQTFSGLKGSAVRKIIHRPSTDHSHLMTEIFQGR